MRRVHVTCGAALAAAVLAGCAVQNTAAPPFKPVANIDQLMDGVLTPAAEVYWDAVSIVVDESGETENFPETDEEWEAVWGAAITLAESGNLLMMSPRAVDDGEWMRMAEAMVDVGIDAAAAAEAQDPDAVLEVGERVYNVCLDCHNRYVVDVVD
ncbi:MAG: hypothetical protein JXB36_08845 [Gammaproteobacteria bacterium]|nr:hypothetical protein [Gammaproteobacteria bacterium]